MASSATHWLSFPWFLLLSDTPDGHANDTQGAHRHALVRAQTVAGVGAVKVERPQRSEDERP